MITEYHCLKLDTVAEERDWGRALVRTGEAKKHFPTRYNHFVLPLGGFRENLLRSLINKKRLFDLSHAILFPLGGKTPRLLVTVPSHVQATGCCRINAASCPLGANFMFKVRGLVHMELLTSLFWSSGRTQQQSCFLANCSWLGMFPTVYIDSPPSVLLERMEPSQRFPYCAAQVDYQGRLKASSFSLAPTCLALCK